MENKKQILLIFGYVAIVSVLFSGCAQQALKATSTTRFTQDEVLYEVIPYTPKTHQQLNFDPMFAELEFNTAFVIRVTNLSNHPIKTSLYSTLILRDNQAIQFKPIQNPFLYLRSNLPKNIYSDLSYRQLRDTDIEIQYLVDSNMTTQNVQYYQNQLAELRQKISVMEQNQQYRDELDRREKMLASKLDQFGFKDQILYAQGSSQGLVVFPPIPADRLTQCTLFLTLPPDQVVTVDFKLVQTDVN